MSEALADLRGRLLLLKKESQTIGQAPPRPNTLRASLSGIFVSIMQRLMFWYAPPLQRTIGGLIETFDDALARIGTQLDQESQRSTSLETRLHQVHGIIDQQIQDLRRNDMAGREERIGLEERIKEQTLALQQERASTIDLENNAREQVDAFQQFQEDRLAREKDLARELNAANERLQMLRREVVEQSRRVAQLLDEARRRLPAPLDEGQLRAFEQEARHDLDAVRVSLEAEARGPREEVRERLRVYLPLLEQARARKENLTVLDVGCGRGEWLELLRNEGYSARGVEWNRILVEDCRGRELNVEEGEALERLGGVPDASVSVVTAFRLAERLPFGKLVLLLDEVTRVLQTGGLAILETPNPDNLLVGARDFYKDPTRHHPIPGETLRLLLESRGLSQVNMLPAFANGVDGGQAAERLNTYFSAPREYAVVGVKA